MENPAESNARRLERINRYLMLATAALAITVVILAIIDFA